MTLISAPGSFILSFMYLVRLYETLRCSGRRLILAGVARRGRGVSQLVSNSPMGNWEGYN
jgi:hypothetical protein